MKTLLSTLSIATVSLLCLALRADAQADELKVGVSIYAGWMDSWVMEMKMEGKKKPTWLEAESAKTGGRVSIKKFERYTDSVEALAAGSIDAVTVTLQEAVTIIADKGVDVVILYAHDYSNGNDQLRVPAGWTKESLKGKTVLGEELSVSNYLAFRFFQINNLPLKDYCVWKNTPGDDVGKAYISALNSASPVAGITWNPNCQRMAQTGKDSALFTSREIPNEITDTLAIRKDRISGHEKSIAAYVAAHFRVMDAMTNPKTRARTIQAMAVAADFGDEVPLYTKMLDDTHFYTTRVESIALLESPTLPEVLKRVREFYATYGHPNAQAATVTFDTRFLK